jgi:hypothetical protein
MSNARPLWRTKWALTFAVCVLAVLFSSAGVALANPYIEYASPGFGAIGDMVVITGTGFGDTAGQVIFQPGDRYATVGLWSDTYAICYVPNGVEATSTLSLSCGLGTSNSVDFWAYDRVWGFVFDGHGGTNGNSVQGAKVELKDRDTDEVLDTAYSRNNGEFLINRVLDSSKRYRLTVTLETEDGRLKMKRDGTVVSFSRDFTWTNMGLAANFFPAYWNLSKTDQIDEASMAKGDIENCAAVWHYLWLNREVAKDVGKDIASPLTLDIFATGANVSEAYFSKGRNAIVLGTTLVDDISDADPPPWQYRKNRESHEFGHALMWSMLGSNGVAPADKANHAGYVNGNTGDSLSEGFAEFWAMYADARAGFDTQPMVYDQWGYITGLDKRMAWAPLNTAQPMTIVSDWPQEEMAVAGLMYELWDGTGIGQSVSFQKIADAIHTGDTLKDFYGNLLGAGLPKAAVDQLFIRYGFFSDTDGDWTYDTGEVVGSASNGAECMMIYSDASGAAIETTVAVRFGRWRRPYEPNAFLQVDLVATDGALTDSTVTVTVSNPGRRTYSYSTQVSGDTALIYIPLMTGGTASVGAVGPAGAAASEGTITITGTEWNAARASIASGPVLTETMHVSAAPAVEETGIPTACTLSSASATLNYGARATISGTLLFFSVGFPNTPVQLQSSPDGAVWTGVDTPVTTTVLGGFSFGVTPASKTYYRVAFAGSTGFRHSESAAIVLTPKAYAGTPVAPAKMSKKKSSTVYAYIKPGHVAGTYPVRIYKYRLVGRAWKPYGYVNAKASDYSTYTKCTASVRLSTAGKWRLRAYAPADDGHAANWSSGFDNVTVK